MSKEKFADDEILIRSARREDMVAVADMIKELAEFEKMTEGPKLSVLDLQRDGFDARPPAFSCLVAERGARGAAAERGARGAAAERGAGGAAAERGAGGAAAERGAGGAAALVGYAIYFPTYSTWEGSALMLEDLYVRPAVRRRGVGQRLFDAVAKEAYSAGCSRLDFHVLEWNEARQFYERKGAVNLTAAERWCYYRLAGDRLRDVAKHN